MDKDKEILTKNKYKLPYHWLRDPLNKYSLSYFGYAYIVVDIIRLFGVKKCLDAGCGDGRISNMILSTGIEVIGLEYFDHQVQYAKNLNESDSFFTCDLRNEEQVTKSVGNKRFDAVVCVEVYEHIPPEDCPTVLGNLKKTVKEKGILVLSVPTKNLPMSQLHYRHFTKDEIVKEVENSGFKIVDVIYQHRLNYIWSVLSSPSFELLFENSIVQLTFLKILRKKLFDKYLNRTSKYRDAARMIIVAECL